MVNNKLQSGASLVSLFFAFLASSHHWLHMGVLMLIGGSAGMSETIAAVAGLRRGMIVMTLAMVLFSIYRLWRHRCKTMRMLLWTGLSAVLSLGFISYTLVQFGW